MKRIASFLLALACVLTAAGCGAAAPEPSGPVSPAASSARTDEGPEVLLRWADGALDLPCDTFKVEDGEGSAGLLFTAPGGVRDFRLLALAMRDAPGGVTFDTEELYAQDTLGPDRGLVVQLIFYGDLPEYGVAYTDAAGTTHRCTVEVSGMDGSLVMNEF